MWTEKQIEEWLEQETRDLISADGRRIVCTMFRLHWSKLEALIICRGFSTAMLVEFAEQEVKLQGFQFNRAMEGVVAYLAREAFPR